MMYLEQQLAKTDLNQFKTAPLDNIALNCVKYQNFKTTAILSKINYAPYKTITARQYLNRGIKYIQTKDKAVCNHLLVEAIDRQLDKCVQPLTPSKKEERPKDWKRSRRRPVSITTPTETTTTTITTSEPITKFFYYGLKYGDIIKIMDEQKCLDVIENLKWMDKDKDVYLVHVDYEIVC